jgi:nucleoside-diphosphate-sugar epimerase
VAINWQYVEDVSEMIVHALAAPNVPDVAFNTTGDVRTFREAAEVLAELRPGTPMTFLTEPRDAAERALCEFPSEFDDSALREQLGYTPAYPLERGIADAYAALTQPGGGHDNGRRA